MPVHGSGTNQIFSLLELRRRSLALTRGRVDEMDWEERL